MQLSLNDVCSPTLTIFFFRSVSFKDEQAREVVFRFFSETNLYTLIVVFKGVRVTSWRHFWGGNDACGAPTV